VTETHATTRLAVVGDRDPANETHVFTDAALGHAAAALGVDAEVTWLPTPEIAAGRPLAPYDGFLVAPGSPYASLDGALAAVTHARTGDVPLLGTCGGLQHVVIELARNVLGEADAAHAEIDPDAANLFVTPLVCSVAGRTMTVSIAPRTRAADAYGTISSSERYYCNFAINPARLPDLVAAGLAVTGVDAEGEVRIVELPDRRWFVATLFVPQATTTPEAPHPLVRAFVAAAARVPTSAP